MAYDVSIKLPQGWVSDLDSYLDESGVEITHLSCHLPNDRKQTDEALIDAYVGPMPEDTTAADQALANYADTVGFDDDDPEDFDPIIEWPFNGKKAYGFEALAEDDSPMRMMCYEPRKGILVILVVLAKDDDTLVEAVQLAERGLRLK